MSGKKHVHKYHKIEVNNELVWACAMPDCSHHMPKHYENTVIGKYSFCWNCNEKFILDEQVMKRDMPFCHNCLDGKIVVKELNEVIVPVDFNIDDLIGKK